MPILLFLLLVLNFQAAVAQDALVPPPSPPVVYTQPHPMNVLGIPLQAGDPVGKLRFVEALELKNESYRFGGFSGLAMKGERLLAVTDEGQLLTATLKRETNTITGFTDILLRPLWPEGKNPDKKEYDAEGLALLPDGSLLIAFEQFHRLARYTPGGVPQLQRSWPAPAELKKLAKPNEGFEAVVALTDTRAFALAENAPDEVGNHTGYLVNLLNGRTEKLKLKATETFHPTDLTTLPNGDLLLLERSYSVLGGVAARISLLKKVEIVPNTLLVPTELARLASGSGVDNMEGIAALPAKSGETDIFLLSDDNFNPLQKTILVWLKLPRHLQHSIQ